MELAQQDQVTALQQARTNIAADRATRLGFAEECHRDKENVRIAIERFKNKRQVAAIPKQDLEKSAKALRAAYLGSEIPHSIVNELDAKAKQIKKYEDRIREIDTALEELDDKFTEADAQHRLAQAAVDEIDSQIQQIDRCIAEIRGF